MALTGLNLLNDESQSSAIAIDFNYPDVVEILDYIYSQEPQLLQSNDHRQGKLLFPSKTFLAMIKFLMKCFEASDSPDLSQEDPSHSPVAKMCVVLEHAMSYEGSSELHALALKSLVDISSRQPKVFVLFIKTSLILSSHVVTFSLIICSWYRHGMPTVYIG
jgi:proteasome component ECM29